MVETRGWVDDRELQEVHAAEYYEGEVVEIVALALTLFTNYFHHVASMEVDSPRVGAERAAGAGAAS